MIARGALLGDETLLDWPDFPRIIEGHDRVHHEHANLSSNCVAVTIFEEQMERPSGFSALDSDGSFTERGRGEGITGAR